MKTKKILAACLAGAMLSLTPVAGALVTSPAPVAYAAKGGARMAVPKAAPAPAPKAAPAAPKAGADTHKSVSGNGGSYAPSKSASELPKNAPANNAPKPSTNMAANAGTASGSRFGSALRNIGLFAGGMFLGSALAHMLGMGTGGFMADALGFIVNLVLLYAVIRLALWAWRSYKNGRGGGSGFGGGSQSAEDAYRRGYEEAMREQRGHGNTIDVTPKSHSAESANGGEAKDIADRYRNM